MSSLLLTKDGRRGSRMTEGSGNLWRLPLINLLSQLFFFLPIPRVNAWNRCKTGAVSAGTSFGFIKVPADSPESASDYSDDSFDDKAFDELFALLTEGLEEDSGGHMKAGRAASNDAVLPGHADAGREADGACTSGRRLRSRLSYMAHSPAHMTCIHYNREGVAMHFVYFTYGRGTSIHGRTV
ncbi:hypothetical protein EVAR_60587_1 [Eumeta japonica]|uniref:Uncharacterized protein n=1 Tax=Eumeta variegata TaxID=151549 RepID=A0A4C1YJ52_EUMVA|nr:hypothetical protein EVAR_60587_1 [Eumeta japonica]